MVIAREQSVVLFLSFKIEKFSNFEKLVNGDSKGTISSIIFCLLNLMYHHKLDLTY
jgi:hypothetical protein